MSITSKVEFDNASAILCGRMVSLNAATRKEAAQDAAAMIATLPKHIKNSPHIVEELNALYAGIARVDAE